MTRYKSFTSTVVADAKQRKQSVVYECDAIARKVRLHKVAFDALGKAARAAARDDGEYYAYTVGSDAVSIRLRLTDLDSFGDARLVYALTTLELAGVTFDHTHDFTVSEDPNREYTATVQFGESYTPDGLRVRITVDAFVRSDSPLCKRVPKSTKMVEQVEYEIVCSGGPTYGGAK